VEEAVPDAHAYALAELTARVEGLGGELSQQRFDREQQFGVMASLQVGLERVVDGLARLHEQRELERIEQRNYLPIYTPIQGSGICPASGILRLNCGGPAQGRVWSVRRLVVGGAQLASTVNGTAEVYAYGGPPDLNQPMLSELLDATILIGTPLTPLPNIGYYEPGQAVVMPPAGLWILIRNGSAGVQYTVGGTAVDYKVDGYDNTFDL
jgi:hypothetical protein